MKNALQKLALFTFILFSFFACAEEKTETSGPEASTDTETETSTEAATTPEVDEGEKLSWEGLDVSHYQGNVDWAKVAASGKKFAFCKATQGTSMVDPDFEKNWAGMKEAGLMRGAYHFFEPKDDAAQQADFFLSTVKLEKGDFVPVLDIEITEGEATPELQKGVKMWLKKVEAAVGMKPIIYSDYAFLKADLPEGFCMYPLWLADYAEHSPEGVACWEHWDLLQYSASGTVDGIEGSVDLDRFEGTEGRLETLQVK